MSHASDDEKIQDGLDGKTSHHVVEVGGNQHTKIVDLGAQVEKVEYTEEESNSVLRRIDLRLIPMLVWIYGIQYADKTTLNYASLMGIRTDAHLDPNSQQYSWVSSIFYAGFLMAEFPFTYLLKKVPIGKFTSICIICWGIILTMHATAHSYAGLLICRFLLGFFEAVITPAFLLLTSMWYRKHEQAGRMSYWLAANGVATLICSPIAFGLSGVTNAALASWKILYMIFGLITIVTGGFYLYYMPDSQTQVRWLNPRQKSIAVDRLSSNSQGVGNYVWSWYQFREAFKDPRTYLIFLFSACMNIPNGGVGTFGSIIIASFGFDSRHALLLNMPNGIVDLTTKLTLMHLSDRFRDRTAFALIAIGLPFIGGLIMLFGPQDNKGLLLFGYYLIGCSGCGWGLVMTLISNNTIGYTKKATVSGVQIIAYGIGNWIGPQTFRAKDKPVYRTGKSMVAIFYGISLIILVAMRLVNIMENRRRDKLAKEDPSSQIQPEDAAARDLTDFEQPAFRYTL